MKKDSKTEVLGMSTITYKYQVTIPKKVRERYRLKEGNTILFVEEGDRVYIKSNIES